MQGLPTIRAYGAQQRFRDEFLMQMDINGSWWYAFMGTARWVGFRLDLVAAAVLMAASLLIMGIHSRVCPHSRALDCAAVQKLVTTCLCQGNSTHGLCSNYDGSHRIMIPIDKHNLVTFSQSSDLTARKSIRALCCIINVS